VSICTGLFCGEGFPPHKVPSTGNTSRSSAGEVSHPVRFTAPEEMTTADRDLGNEIVSQPACVGPRSCSGQPA
jgi:hypothetical protein